ncbi:NAD(P)H-dependent oxidoreductase [Natronoflexus pectinivorans]|uniref:NAD(P)H dehydrogenase (Quinone) n=1 Tax=Natronoflexus pectinivorans TaxID=682526 RepID=A0A4V2RWM7_9BACT|nr:NAD(P)H-dependent oxidoreductase [Natronoflexus pectinivorans]TCO09200.1 NAD(P)H dehydrogenase (quinone) [Natronoflexus pectinivorans]
MTHLIIVSHPSKNSFSIYLANELANKYREEGWKVIIRDLYDANFQAVLSSDDLGQLKQGAVPDDIQTEQRYIKEADLISVIYPLWWASFPGILKGYIDRVLTNGFAFNYGANGATGLLTDKKVVIHTTMGNTVEEYEEKDLITAFKKSQGEEVFGFCGMTIKGHYFYPQITLADEAKRDHFLQFALSKYPELEFNNVLEK